MKKLLLIPMFALAGCASPPNLVRTKLQVVTPPDSFYDCPIEKQYPNWQTLNDVEVAKTILKLHKNNVRCHNSIMAIKKFLADSKAKLEE